MLQSTGVYRHVSSRVIYAVADIQLGMRQDMISGRKSLEAHSLLLQISIGHLCKAQHSPLLLESLLLPIVTLLLKSFASCKAFGPPRAATSSPIVSPSPNFLKLAQKEET